MSFLIKCFQGGSNEIHQLLPLKQPQQHPYVPSLVRGWDNPLLQEKPGNLLLFHGSSLVHQGHPKRGFCLKLMVEVCLLKACHLNEQRSNCFLKAVVGKWKCWRFTHKSPLIYLHHFIPWPVFLVISPPFCEELLLSLTCGDLPAWRF